MGCGSPIRQRSKLRALKIFTYVPPEDGEEKIGRCVIVDKMPLISIIIPVYNGSNYLADAVDSALYQVYEKIEVIVVNDGSSDDGKTRDIALSYGDKIRYFEKSNGGVSSALNLGIKNMRGDCFSWLSHDDIYHPHNIYLQVNNLIKGGGNFVSACSTATFSDYPPAISIPIDNQAQSLTRPLEFWTRWIYACSLVIPKSILFEVNGLNESNQTNQDVELTWELLRVSEIRMLNATLVFRRVHFAQDFQNPDIVPLNVREGTSLLKRKINEYGIEYFLSDASSNAKKAFGFLFLAVKYSENKRRISVEGPGLIKWLLGSAYKTCPSVLSPFWFFMAIPCRVFIFSVRLIKFSRKVALRLKKRFALILRTSVG